jgi:hypothetical protein
MLPQDLLTRTVLGETVVVVVELVDGELALTPQLPDRRAGRLLHTTLENVCVCVERATDLSAWLEVEGISQRSVAFSRIPAGKVVLVQVREYFMAPLLKFPTGEECAVGADTPCVGREEADPQMT